MIFATSYESSIVHCVKLKCLNICLWLMLLQQVCLGVKPPWFCNLFIAFFVWFIVMLFLSFILVADTSSHWTGYKWNKQTDYYNVHLNSQILFYTEQLLTRSITECSCTSESLAVSRTEIFKNLESVLVYLKMVFVDKILFILIFLTK